MVEEDFPEVTSPFDWTPLEFSVDRDVLRKLDLERLRRFLKRGILAKAREQCLEDARQED